MTTETPTASPAPAGPPPGEMPAPAPRAVSGALWLALVALTVAVLVALYAHRQLDGLKRESARRFAELQRQAADAIELANRADAEARAARRQAAAIEARVAEEQGQREALEQLYSDLTGGRDEAVLVEVERLITLAAQELQIGGNVPTALAALQTADARLARADNARFLPLRRVLASDIERLKIAPTVDRSGIALKLDQIGAAVERWPLLADATAVTADANGANAGTATQAELGPDAEERSWWERAVDLLRRELSEHRDLIRVRRVDSPEALLLTAPQQQLLRQQIQLRLLSARHALLARNDRLYRADLAHAQELMQRFVDTRDPQASAALAELRQLAATPLSVDVPQIGETLAAVRAARAPGR